MLRDRWLLALGKQYTGTGVNRVGELQDITNFLSLTAVNQNIQLSQTEFGKLTEAT
jgi:hypothetical protein